jgi:predicted AAA+ superfamily ATPase
MFINRFLKEQILEVSKFYRVITLTGPRQSGKTTLADEKQLQTHPLRGALFENMMINEMLKERYNAGKDNNPKMSIRELPFMSYREAH